MNLQAKIAASVTVFFIIIPLLLLLESSVGVVVKKLLYHSYSNFNVSCFWLTLSKTADKSTHLKLRDTVQFLLCL